MQDLSQAFPSEGTTADLVVRADASQQDDVAAALAEVEAAAEESPLFRPSGTQVEVSTDGTVSVLTLAMPFEESDHRVDTAIKEIRSDLAPAALDDLSGPGRVRRRRRRRGVAATSWSASSRGCRW